MLMRLALLPVARREASADVEFVRGPCGSGGRFKVAPEPVGVVVTSRGPTEGWGSSAGVPSEDGDSRAWAAGVSTPQVDTPEFTQEMEAFRSQVRAALGVSAPALRNGRPWLVFGMQGWGECARLVGSKDARTGETLAKTHRRDEQRHDSVSRAGPTLRKARERFADSSFHVPLVPNTICVPPLLNKQNKSAIKAPFSWERLHKTC